MEEGTSNEKGKFTEVLEEQTSHGSPPEEVDSLRPGLQVLHHGH